MSSDSKDIVLILVVELFLFEFKEIAEIYKIRGTSPFSINVGPKIEKLTPLVN